MDLLECSNAMSLSWLHNIATSLFNLSHTDSSNGVYNKCHNVTYCTVQYVRHMYTCMYSREITRVITSWGMHQPQWMRYWGHPCRIRNIINTYAVSINCLWNPIRVCVPSDSVVACTWWGRPLTMKQPNNRMTYIIYIYACALSVPFGKQSSIVVGYSPGLICSAPD